MTKRSSIKLEPSNWSKDYPVLRESEHYKIVRNVAVNPMIVDADNYLLILKEQETVEAHSHAYVIILMHMLDAEAAYDNAKAPDARLN